jgi:ribosomal protein L22
VADEKQKPETEEPEVEAPEADATAPEPDAEAGVDEPEAEAPADEPEADAPAEEPEAEAAPAKKPRRSRRKAADEEPAEEPAPEPRKPAREPGERPVVRAQAKYVRTSARKARLVCDHIRGKSVPEARAILAHTPRSVAEDWSKLLESAVANAEHNHELIGDELTVATISADEGPTLKRFRPRAQGRASRIRKRTSHLTITLTPKE